MSQHIDLWRKILHKISQEIPRPALITWFKNSAILKISDTEVVIGTPLPIAFNWLNTHYREEIIKAFQEDNPKIETITYEIDASLNASDPRVIDLLREFPEKKKARKLPNKAQVKVVEGITSKILNPKYTFKDFIVGSNNRLAHAASMAVSANPGAHYNPLFIYGGVGLGKTHLLQAIGNEVLSHDPHKYVAYITAEDFTNEVVEAIKKQKMPNLRDRYRKLDVLIIDDIQFIANKDRTQEEFFHTFNALYDANKQVIISSDRPPSELDILEPRLRSRFEMGMIGDVSEPDFETRLAILHHKAAEYNILLSQDVLECIAYNVKNNVRELEGVLKQVVAQYELAAKMPTVNSVMAILKRLRKETKMVGFEDMSKKEFVKSIDDLIDATCQHFNVPRKEVLGHSRLREYVLPRQIAMYLGRTKMNMSVTRLGDIFDGRDHTSVVHASKKIERSIKTDQQLMRNINAIKEECGFM